MALCAVAAGSPARESTGKLDSTVGNSKTTTRLNPKAAAMSPITSDPRSMPNCPKIVLHDRTKAVVRSTSASSPQVLRSALRITAVEPGRSSSAASTNIVSGLASPDSSAAAAVTTLKADPGARVVSTARLVSGWVSSAVSASPAAEDSPSKRAGSKDGEEYIARISPVIGSRATMAPAWPASCSWAAC